MNNPVAGGVVAWLVTDTETGMTRVNEYESVVGASWMKQEALVRASDLQTCQQRLSELEPQVAGRWFARCEAAEAALAAVQAEADRLRVEVEEARRHGGRFVLRAEAAEMDAVRLKALLDLVPIGELNDWLDADMERYERAPTLDEFRAAIDTAIHAAKTEQERGE